VFFTLNRDTLGVSIFPSKSVIGRTLRNLLRVQSGLRTPSSWICDITEAASSGYSHYSPRYKIIGTAFCVTNSFSFGVTETLIDGLSRRMDSFARI
jgi:hypothetical protein